MGIVHNGEESPSSLTRAVQTALLEDLPMASIITYVQALLNVSEPITVSHVWNAAKSSNLQPEKIVEQLYSSQTNSSLSEQVLFSRTVLKLSAGQNTIICNGRVNGL